MPRKRGYKKRPRSRRGMTYTKNKAGNIGPLTNRITSKLCYETGQVGNTTTTSPGTFTIRLNSLFDPQYAVGGHQPRGFDEMSAIYGEYRVLAAKVVMVCQPLSAGSHIFGWCISSSASPPGDVNSFMETRKKGWKFGTDYAPIKLTKYTSIANAYGASPQKIRTEDDFSAGVGSDPAAVPYLHMFWQNNDESTSSGFNVRACIEFYTVFSHPSILAQS